MEMMFTKNDYRRLKEGETYKDKFVILNIEFFAEPYKSAKFQLFLAKGGFGCDPAKLGSKIFGMYYDEPGMINRQEVLGVATEEAIKEWEKTYGISRKVFEKGSDN